MPAQDGTVRGVAGGNKERDFPQDLEMQGNKHTCYPRNIVSSWLGNWMLIGRPQAHQGVWGNAPLDILLHIMQLSKPGDLKAPHLVCRSWCEAVRIGTRELTPRRLCPVGLTQSFPGLRTLQLVELVLDEATAQCVGRQTRLETLHIMSCDFTPGSGVSSLTSLTRLKVLEMTDVEGPTGAEMDGAVRALTALRRLVARKTHGGPKLPQMRGVTRLLDLQELMLADMTHNHMLLGHASLASLTSLRSLTLYRVGVTNGLLRAASQLTGLSLLDIRDSFGVTDAGLPHLSTLTGLKHLDLCCIAQRREEDLSDQGIAVISCCSHLTRLSLSGHAALSARGLTFVSRLTNLQSLDLSGISLWAGGIDFLGPLTALTRLDLNRTALNSSQLRVLSAFTNVRSLSLSQSSADEETVAVLTQLTGLTYLDIRFCQVRNQGIASQLRACQGLQVLLLDGCPVSTFGVLSTLQTRKGIRLWGPEVGPLAAWRERLEMVMMIHRNPHTRELRFMAQREDSVLLAVLLVAVMGLACVLYFFFVIIIIVGFFVIPLAALLLILALLIKLTTGWEKVCQFTKRLGSVMTWIRCSCLSSASHDAGRHHFPDV